MKMTYRRSVQSIIPGYHENAALQLVVVNGVGFTIFHFIRVLLLITGTPKEEVFMLMYPNAALPASGLWLHKFWTLFTYGWVHTGFWDWFTNMVWLYCFASVLQTIASYKQVIPLFIYALIVGGLFYLGGQYIPGGLLQVGTNYFCGAQAGVMALAIAALTLAPGYKMYLAPSFGIPFILVVAIYFILNVVAYVPHQLPVLVLIAGGAFSGFIYAMLLKRGRQPGIWAYDILDALQRLTTPDQQHILNKKNLRRNQVTKHMYQSKHGISKQKIDEILDKINATGYHSLSKDEKDVLLRAGKETE